MAKAAEAEGTASIPSAGYIAPGYLGLDLAATSLKEKKVIKGKKTSFKDGLDIHQARLGARLSLDYGSSEADHIWGEFVFSFCRKWSIC